MVGGRGACEEHTHTHTHIQASHTHTHTHTHTRACICILYPTSAHTLDVEAVGQKKARCDDSAGVGEVRKVGGDRDVGDARGRGNVNLINLHGRWRVVRVNSADERWSTRTVSKLPNQP